MTRRSLSNVVRTLTALSIGFLCNNLSAATLTWTSTADGSWGTSGNWSGSDVPGDNFPTEKDAVVLDNNGFSDITVTTKRTITLDGTYTLSSLTLSTPGTATKSYVLNGTGTLIFDAGKDGDGNPLSATLTSSNAGTSASPPQAYHQIATNIQVGSPLSISVAAGSGNTTTRTLHLSGNITGTPANSKVSINLNGGGGSLSKVYLSGNNDFGGGEINLSSSNSIVIGSTNALHNATLRVTGGDSNLNDNKKIIVFGGHNYSFNELSVEATTQIALTQSGFATPNNSTVGWGSTRIADNKTLQIYQGSNVTFNLKGAGKYLSLGTGSELQIWEAQSSRYIHFYLGDGALLEGSGRISTKTTAGTLPTFYVDAGGVVDPGTGEGKTGILSFGKMTDGYQSTSVVMRASSTLRMQLNGLVAGTDHDQLAVDAGTFSLIETGDGVELKLSLGYAYLATDVVKLINVSSDATFSGVFHGLAEGALVDLGEYNGGAATAYISYVGGDGNDVVLYNFTVIPEPSTVALLWLSAAGACLAPYLRSRRRSA